MTPSAPTHNSHKTNTENVKNKLQIIEGNYCLTYGENDIREHIKIQQTIETTNASHNKSFTYLDIENVTKANE